MAHSGWKPLRLGLGMSVLFEKFHHQTMSFPGIGNESASVMETFTVKADNLVIRAAKAEGVSHL
jgi:hypothetical protein